MYERHLIIVMKIVKQLMHGKRHVRMIIERLSNEIPRQKQSQQLGQLARLSHSFHRRVVMQKQGEQSEIIDNSMIKLMIGCDPQQLTLLSRGSPKQQKVLSDFQFPTCLSFTLKQRLID